MKVPFPLRLMHQAHRQVAAPVSAPRCVAPARPVAAGECARERECYLWRALKPDEPLGAFADLVLAVNAARSVS